METTVEHDNVTTVSIHFQNDEIGSGKHCTFPEQPESNIGFTNQFCLSVHEREL